jgi:hypothetical protein
VKWKGLPQEESSWEPEENLKNARGVIRDFFKRAITELNDDIPLPSPSLSPRLKDDSPPIIPTPNGVTTRYGLLHYANLIRRTGPYLFSLSNYLI